MALNTYKPTSPGRRQLVTVNKSHLHKGAPEKTLVESMKKSGGRNNTGRITVRRMGGSKHGSSYSDIPDILEMLRY